MAVLPPVVEELGNRLTELGWVSELFVGGSLATGDYVPRVSDLDLVRSLTGRLMSAARPRWWVFIAVLTKGSART